MSNLELETKELVIENTKLLEELDEDLDFFKI